MTDMQFAIGPPDPVTDSRDLPAVSPEDEGFLVGGADLGADHPDNVWGAADYVATLRDTSPDDEEDLPGVDEVAALVADVDTSDVDEVGFDASDVGDS